MVRSREVTIRPASDRSLLISFGGEISLEAHHQVRLLTQSLEGLRGILNLHPAYASVLTVFDPRLRPLAEMRSFVRERLEPPILSAPSPARTVEIPVRY